MSSSSNLPVDMPSSSQAPLETQASRKKRRRGRRPDHQRTSAQDSTYNSWSYSTWFGPQPSEKSAQASSWSENTGQSGMPEPLPRTVIFKHTTLKQLSVWQKADSQLLPIIATAVQAETPCTKPDFIMANGVLFRRVPSTATQNATLKVVVPGRLRSSFLSDAHQTKDGQHWTTGIMTSVIAANYYWPTIFEDSQEVVVNCPVCNFKNRF